MLSLYDLWLSGKGYYQLARFFPQMKDATAPIHPVPDVMEPWTKAGPYPVRAERTDWGWATLPDGFEGPIPVLLFSGGAAADGTNCEQLTRHLASYGYAVLEPHHGDAFSHHFDRHGNSWRTWKGTFWDAWRMGLPYRPLWRNRVQDLIGVVDRLSIIGDQLGVALDPNTVAMAGYSYGAQIALMFGGFRYAIDGRLENWTDERIRAAVAIAPEPGGRQTPGNAPRALAIPAIVLSGDRDRDLRLRSWEAKANIYEKFPPGDKWLAVLRGANHFAFSGRLVKEAKSPEQLAAQTSLFGATKALSTLFLETVLKENPEARLALEELEKTDCDLLRLWSK